MQDKDGNIHAVDMLGRSTRIENPITYSRDCNDTTYAQTLTEALRVQSNKTGLTQKVSVKDVQEVLAKVNRDDMSREVAQGLQVKSIDANKLSDTDTVYKFDNCKASVVLLYDRDGTEHPAPGRHHFDIGVAYEGDFNQGWHSELSDEDKIPDEHMDIVQKIVIVTAIKKQVQTDKPENASGSYYALEEEHDPKARAAVTLWGTRPISQNKLEPGDVIGTRRMKTKINPKSGAKSLFNHLGTHSYIFQVHALKDGVVYGHRPVDDVDETEGQLANGMTYVTEGNDDSGHRIVESSLEITSQHFYKYQGPTDDSASDFVLSPAYDMAYNGTYSDNDYLISELIPVMKARQTKAKDESYNGNSSSRAASSTPGKSQRSDNVRVKVDALETSIVKIDDPGRQMKAIMYARRIIEGAYETVLTKVQDDFNEAETKFEKAAKDVRLNQQLVERVMAKLTTENVTLEVELLEAECASYVSTKVILQAAFEQAKVDLTRARTIKKDVDTAVEMNGTEQHDGEVVEGIATPGGPAEPVVQASPTGRTTVSRPPPSVSGKRPSEDVDKTDANKKRKR